jgi:WD40 repeat protein
VHPGIPCAHFTCVTQMIVYQGNTIISGDCSSFVRVWKYAKPVFVLRGTLIGHTGQVSGLAVIDNILWLCSIDGSICLWDSTSGDCRYVTTKGTLTSGVPCGHSRAVTGLLTFDMPRAHTLVLSSSLDGTIKVRCGTMAMASLSSVETITVAYDNTTSTITLGALKCKQVPDKK